MPPAPATSAPHLSAGVAVARHDAAAGWLFLLLRVYRSWDFPKGMVEPGEDPFAAAVREVREESTIADLEFPLGHDFIETGPYARNKVARYYLGVTRTARVTLPVVPELGKPEHHEWRWVDYEQALDLVSPRVLPVVEWAAARLAAAAVADTAGMLRR
ncbi:MAG: NUDIX domain-containing protein [Steroidobacteraceae bacterium]|jgi:8-oxo-dGTP pyrophosphatase MutT (NUDIX family)|nr:NUDIX domain-containing protein [Steroidobacteraceae bacterium]